MDGTIHDVEEVNISEPSEPKHSKRRQKIEIKKQDGTTENISLYGDFEVKQ